MAFCTKLNITSCLSHSGLRFQPYSTGHEATGSTKNRHEKLETISYSKFNVQSHSCSKNKVIENCFVSGADANHMEYLFSKWIKNINSVHKSWQHYFSEFIENQSKTVQSKVAANKYKGFQLQETVASNSSNNWPPMSPHEQTCVVGHINLCPSTDNKSINVQDLIRKTSKPANKSDKNVNKKQMEKNNNIQTMKRIERTLEGKDFIAGRKAIKEQLKIMQKNKSLERKNSTAGIVVKKSKENNDTAEK